MATRQSKNSRFSGLAIPVACLCILAYFSYHAFQGSLGIQSRALMDQKNLQLQFELARLREARQDMERKVSLLRDGNLEKDMLDQQVRHMLNLVKSNEVVILRAK